MSVEDIKKALAALAPLTVEFTPDSSESNAIISPSEGYHGTYFTLIGAGDKQDDMGNLIMLSVNSMPELLTTLESLQRDNAILQERTADYPTISAKLHDREKARDAEQKYCREAIARAEAVEAEAKRYRSALIAAKTRMRNCCGAIESDQVVDKDVHGSLQNGILDIQEALASTGGEHNEE